MRLRLPIRVRLTVIFAAITALVLAITGSFVFLMFESGLDEEVDRGLENQAATIVEALGQSDLLPPGDNVLVAPTEPITQIYSPSGTLTLSRGVMENTRLLPITTLARLRDSTFFVSNVSTGQEVVRSQLYATRTDQGSIVLVGTPLTARDSALSRLALLLWIVGPATLLVTTAIGWRMAGGALKPVERMRAEAAEITSSAADRRLSVPDTGDEVARLGTTLNEMLDRLEEALSRERRLVDDASHELRTPLATLRMELELALRRSRSREELEAALASAHEESGRLNRLAEDLLVLARVDHGRLPVRRSSVDLDDLIDELKKDFEGRATAAGVSMNGAVEVAEPVSIDPDRIRQALVNLIENSLRHTDPEGSVAILARKEDDDLVLSVVDTGPGFPPGFLPHAFEPFARPDGARGRDAGGTGLGLAIVKAVAESHGGSASAGNGPDRGAQVVLRIPV